MTMKGSKPCRFISTLIFTFSNGLKLLIKSILIIYWRLARKNSSGFSSFSRSVNEWSDKYFFPTPVNYIHNLIFGIKIYDVFKPENNVFNSLLHQQSCFCFLNTEKERCVNTSIRIVYKIIV